MALLLQAAAAQTNQSVQVELLVAFLDGLRHVPRASVNQHAVRLIAAGAENRAADREDSRERGLVQLQTAVFDDAAESITETNNVHAVLASAAFRTPTPRIAALRPGLSPPAVKMPIRLPCPLSVSI